MRKLFLILALFLMPLAATAQQLGGQEVFEILTAKTRDFSGGSVSDFKPDGTFVMTHSNGVREKGTYRITKDGLVKVDDRATGTKYTFTVRQGDGAYLFTYRSGPGRGKTYSFK